MNRRYSLIPVLTLCLTAACGKTPDGMIAKSRALPGTILQRECENPVRLDDPSTPDATPSALSPEDRFELSEMHAHVIDPQSGEAITAAAWKASATGNEYRARLDCSTVQKTPTSLQITRQEWKATQMFNHEGAYGEVLLRIELENGELKTALAHGTLKPETHLFKNQNQTGEPYDCGQNTRCTERFFRPDPNTFDLRLKIESREASGLFREYYIRTVYKKT